ncbi:mitotic spindle assembly checkpoint protein mad1 [Ilyonectria robusta]
MTARPCCQGSRVPPGSVEDLRHLGRSSPARAIRPRAGCGCRSLKAFEGRGRDGQDFRQRMSTDKARLRVEYLRAQLKTFDTEDETLQPEQFDQARVMRVQELEDLVDKYKTEVQSLHGELASVEPDWLQLKTFDTEDETPQPEQLDHARMRVQELEDLVDKYKTEVQSLHGELASVKPHWPQLSTARLSFAVYQMRLAMYAPSTAAVAAALDIILLFFLFSWTHNQLNSCIYYLPLPEDSFGVVSANIVFAFKTSQAFGVVFSYPSSPSSPYATDGCVLH